MSVSLAIQLKLNVFALTASQSATTSATRRRPIGTKSRFLRNTPITRRLGSVTQPSFGLASKSRPQTYLFASATRQLLFIPQGVDRVFAGGFEGGDGAEEYANQERHERSHRHDLPADNRRDVGEGVEQEIDQK